ncbi:hypothetical protein GCM10017788_52660 [Amycolatopsis acidiphila]|nr:hypothetical protein GCM10017788_52660 [Amycolatopsis acidiphila]
MGGERVSGKVGRRAFLLLAVGGLASACAGPMVTVAGRANPVSVPSPKPVPVPPPPTPSVSLASPSPLAVARSTADTPLRIGFCGGPNAPALGRMTGNLESAGDQLTRQIAEYHTGHPIQPVVELIATRVVSTPGADGMYRSRESDNTIQSYLDEARRLKGMLLLNIQPGHADFPTEVRAFERWLNEPDVGLALDPEWAVDPGVRPGQKFGHVSGAVLDQVSSYVSDLVRRNNLPPKMMIYHQVATSVVRDEGDLKPHDGVVPIKVVDGIGSAAAKIATWNLVMKQKPDHVQAGFKLFYDEDTRHGTPLMKPEEVLALRPAPTYVVYE